MPITIQNTDGGIGNVIEFYGVVSDREYVDAMEKHLGRPPEEFRRYKYSFLETSALDKVDISASALEHVAYLSEKAAQINADPVIAFVAGSDLAYGLSRTFEALVDQTGWETMVFRSRTEALEWIRKRVDQKFGITELTFC